MPSHLVSAHLGFVVLKPIFYDTIRGSEDVGHVRGVGDEAGKQSMDSVSSERSADDTTTTPSSVSTASKSQPAEGSTGSARGGFWSRYVR